MTGAVDELCKRMNEGVTSRSRRAKMESWERLPLGTTEQRHEWLHVVLDTAATTFELESQETDDQEDRTSLQHSLSQASTAAGGAVHPPATSVVFGRQNATSQPPRPNLHSKYF